MKLYNIEFSKMINVFKEKRIVIFGIGDYFKYYVQEAFPRELIKNVAYAIDNNACGMSVEWDGKTIPVYLPEKLREESECVVMLAGGNFMYEMYQQLENMNLGDGIECYSLSLIMAGSVGKEEESIKKKIFSTAGEEKIAKVIHSFWFSGDEKPEAYQKCVDSWKRVCPDYKIIEWNMNNYDYTKNKFMEQAIEHKKWAFASDFARLDVVYSQGGIYLDMDVELIKPLDSLLGNEAFFSFDTQNDIDLGTFAAKDGNPLVKSLMQLYENVEFSGDMKAMNWFCQPRYIRTVMKKYGLKLNGDMQLIDGMAFLSRNYLAPKDAVIYDMTALCDETLAIHQYNAGWRNDDYRAKRISNNRLLWDMVMQTEVK